MFFINLVLSWDCWDEVCSSGAVVNNERASGDDGCGVEGVVEQEISPGGREYCVVAIIEIAVAVRERGAAAIIEIVIVVPEKSATGII